MGHLAPKRLDLLLLCAALAAPGAARANGFALDIQGLYSNGTASAGAASARDPAGQFANPAVLASLDGSQAVVGGQLIAGKAPFTNDGSTLLGGGMPLGGSNGDGAGTGFAPWAFISHRISPDLAVGFSLTAPFGTATDYGRGSSFVGRYQGIESTITSVAFGPAVAWKPIRQLAIGLSVAARRDRALLGQSFDLGSMCALAGPGAGTADPVGTCQAGLGLTPGQSDVYGRFDAVGWGWTLAGGLTLEPTAGTVLGVAYRHEFQSKVKGQEVVTGPDRLMLFVPDFLGTHNAAGASLKLPLPDFLTASLEQKVGDSVSLVAAFQYTFWKRFDTLHLVPDNATNGFAADVDQKYRNAFRASVGASFAATPWLDTFAGVAFEQSPITTAHRSVTLPERDTILAGLGAEARFGAFSAGAVYQHVQGVGTAKIDQVGLTGDRVVGTVKASANLAVFQLGWRG